MSTFIDCQVHVAKREGFTSSLCIEFPNGLFLRTQDMVFMCGADKQKLAARFREVCEGLGLPAEEIAKIQT